MNDETMCLEIPADDDGGETARTPYPWPEGNHVEDQTGRLPADSLKNKLDIEEGIETIDLNRHAPSPRTTVTERTDDTENQAPHILVDNPVRDSRKKSSNRGSGGIIGTAMNMIQNVRQAAAVAGENSMDPYVRVTMQTHGGGWGPAQKNSYVPSGGCDVQFQEEHLFFRCGLDAPPQLLFEAFDADIGRDDFVGAGVHETSKNWGRLVEGEEIRFFMKIFDAKTKPAGTLIVHYTYNRATSMLDVFVHSARNLKDVNVEEVTDLGEHKDFFTLYGAMFSVALYFGLSLWYFTSPGVIAHASDPDARVTFIDALYFIMVSCTTTGYGDISPQTSTSRLVTSGFVLIGFGLLGVFLGVVAGHLMDMQKNDMNAFAEILRKEGEDDSMEVGDEPPAAEPAGTKITRVIGIARQCVTRSWKFLKWGFQVKGRFDLRRSLLQSVSCLALLLFAGTMFFIHEGEGHTFAESFYFAVMSATTVGYGDFAPSTQDGRLFIALYLFLSTVFVGKSVHDIAHIPLVLRRNRLEHMVLNQYGKDLDPYELKELCSMTINESPEYCTRNEFILGMLLKLDKITQRDITECGQKFDILDLDGSGKLTPDDITDPDAEERNQMTWF